MSSDGTFSSAGVILLQGEWVSEWVRCSQGDSQTKDINFNSSNFLSACRVFVIRFVWRSSRDDPHTTLLICTEFDQLPKTVSRPKMRNQIIN